MTDTKIPESIRFDLCEQLASEVVESMDIDAVVEYAVSMMEERLSILGHDKLVEEAEFFWDDRLESVIENLKENVE